MNKTTDSERQDGVGLYVHVPFCERKCRFCNFYMATGSHLLTSRMVSALIREMELSCAGHQVKTVYIGGGTPSYLPQVELLRLVSAIGSQLCGAVEFTLEANPDQLDRQRLEQLLAAGVNRLSIGAQSFDDQELAWMSRTYTAQHIGHVVEMAKQSGFSNISLDLIYSVPGSDVQKWSQSLQAALDLDVPHISAYSLTYESGTQLFRDVEQGRVKPGTEQQDRDMYDATVAQLAQAGIEQYEVSNFARSGFARQQACETAILMLRQTQGVNLREFKQRYNYDPLELFAKPLKTYQRLGLLEINRDNFHLTPNGMAVADSVLCDFVGC